MAAADKTPYVARVLDFKNSKRISVDFLAQEKEHYCARSGLSVPGECVEGGRMEVHGFPLSLPRERHQPTLDSFHGVNSLGRQPMGCQPPSVFPREKLLPGDSVSGSSFFPEPKQQSAEKQLRRKLTSLLPASDPNLGAAEAPKLEDLDGLWERALDVDLVEEGAQEMGGGPVPSWGRSRTEHRSEHRGAASFLVSPRVAQVVNMFHDKRSKEKPQCAHAPRDSEQPRGVASFLVSPRVTAVVNMLSERESRDKSLFKDRAQKETAQEQQLQNSHRHHTAERSRKVVPEKASPKHPTLLDRSASLNSQMAALGRIHASTHQTAEGSTYAVSPEASGACFVRIRTPQSDGNGGTQVGLSPGRVPSPYHSAAGGPWGEAPSSLHAARKGPGSWDSEPPPSRKDPAALSSCSEVSLSPPFSDGEDACVLKISTPSPSPHCTGLTLVGASAPLLSVNDGECISVVFPGRDSAILEASWAQELSFQARRRAPAQSKSAASTPREPQRESGRGFGRVCTAPARERWCEDHGVGERGLGRVATTPLSTGPTAGLCAGRGARRASGSLTRQGSGPITRQGLGSTARHGPGPQAAQARVGGGSVRGPVQTPARQAPASVKYLPSFKERMKIAAMAAEVEEQQKAEDMRREEQLRRERAKEDAERREEEMREEEWREEERREEERREEERARRKEENKKMLSLGALDGSGWSFDSDERGETASGAEDGVGEGLHAGRGGGGDAAEENSARGAAAGAAEDVFEKEVAKAWGCLSMREQKSFPCLLEWDPDATLCWCTKCAPRMDSALVEPPASYYPDIKQGSFDSADMAPAAVRQDERFQLRRAETAGKERDRDRVGQGLRKPPRSPYRQGALSPTQLLQGPGVLAPRRMWEAGF